jgi:hypothetical protein
MMTNIEAEKFTLDVVLKKINIKEISEIIEKKCN